MTMDNTALARKSLDRRFALLREADFAMPPRGWLRAIREALGMTVRQLASRMGAAPSRITALEKAEVTGSTTLKSLRAAAEAMDCTLVYALVPTSSLEDMVKERARLRAEEELRRVHHTMTLENQALTRDDLADERQRLIDNMLAGSLRGLWDDA
ncbi:putative DNA-binding mobile mystery protein A [Sphingobium fontiphilum]|jgi:predicted DNA-binding mobile mystery protein A|uniref:Putative DNA-binding mobile mystery protein A n=2 Tax=Sphingobium fontiphilum TaxID=944425 RepID=A0A7W6GQJ4_9SPHN|nr:putative DNA-binding mobile mystery protein A [Sphingobium fontiphilum]